MLLRAWAISASGDVIRHRQEEKCGDSCAPVGARCDPWLTHTAQTRSHKKATQQSNKESKKEIPQRHSAYSHNTHSHRAS